MEQTIRQPLIKEQLVLLQKRSLILKRESSIQMERHQDGRVDRIIHDGMENGKTLMITMKLIMWRYVIW